MKNTVVKNIIAILTTIIAVTAFYLGSYLPLRKSQLYIAAYSSISQIKSLDEFNNSFDSILSYYSPVGQDELVSAYLGIILDILSRNGNNAPNRVLTDVLLKKADQWAEPVINHAPGFSYSQTILKLAAIYRVAAQRFNDQGYYNKSVELFKMGLSYSPNRQVFLYNLLDLYLYKNDATDTKPLVQTILKYWPNDERVRRIWDFLNAPPSSAPKKNTK